MNINHLDLNVVCRPWSHPRVFAVLLGLLFAFAMVSNTNAGENNGQRINNKESLRICKSAAQNDLGGAGELKFKRKAATSVESDRFRHWINFVELTGEGKTSKKLLCETSRTGELLSMHAEPGRWRF